MDEEEFNNWLSGLRDRARQRSAPISHYETRWGAARLVVDEADPTQAWFEVERNAGDAMEGDWSLQGDVADTYDAPVTVGPRRVAMRPVEVWRFPIDEDPDARPVREARTVMPRQPASSRFSQSTIARFSARQPNDNFQVAAPPRRTMGERFMFDAWEAQSYGTHQLLFPNPETGRREIASLGSSTREAQREMQGYYAAWDPWYETGDGWLDPARYGHGAAALAGTFAGAIPDPLNLIMPGVTWVSRVAAQGGIGGAQNVVEQASGGSSDRYRAEGEARLARELDRIYREEGVEALDQALAALDADPPETHEEGFNWTEFGIMVAFSSAMQGGFEGASHFSRPRQLRDWVRAREAASREGPDALRQFNEQNPRPRGYAGRLLSPIAEPIVRAATRARIRSMGDPVLDGLARQADGSIDPAALPIETALESTPAWIRQMVPLVERAALATTGEERALAYSEAALRMHDAMARGDDPIEFANALIRADFEGTLPDLRAFRTLEQIARDISNGDLVLDRPAVNATRLARLTERMDPAIARMRSRRRTFRDALARADQDIAARAYEEAGARDPIEVGVGDAHFPRRRTVTDDERFDIDQLADQLAERRTARRGVTLAGWVIRRGGVADDRGDLSAAVGGTRARPGLFNRRGGRSIDDLANEAWEAGYFPDHHERPTPRELIDALGDEINGRRARYARDEQESLALDAQWRDVEDWLEQHGVDPTIRDPARLRNEIADRVYDATYASRIADEADPSETGAPDQGADAGSVEGRAPPQGWGSRVGQAAGTGGGGAMRSPLARVEATITPVHRQTMARRVARAARRRGVATYISDVIARAYTSVFEAQHPIVMQQRELIREIEAASGARLVLQPDENAQILARLSRDGYSAGHLDMVDGVRPYRQPGVKASPSFREAIETATGGREWTPELITRFEAYLIARRAVKAWDRYAAGELPRPPHSMSKADLEDAIRQAELDHPEFANGSALLYRFLEAHWQKKRDAGLITEEQFQAGLKNNEDYVPFQRDMDDSGARPSRGGEEEMAPGQSGGSTNKRRAFQRFRGSDRRILSPLSTIMADVYATSDRIARNETFRAFVNLAERAGPLGEMIAKPIPRPMDRTRIDIVDEAERAIRAAGGSPQDAKALGGQLDALLNGDTSAVIYRPGEVVEGNRHVIYVWRDGQREAWELTDPEWSADLFRAMTGLTQEARDMFIDAIAVPTQAIRTAITAWPGFQFANIIRDSISAWMVTDVGYKPGEAALGAAQVLRQGDLAKLYNAVGTQGGGMVRAALPRSKVQRDLPALRGRVLRTRNLDPREGAATLWRAFETATELSENASRIQLFARAYERAKRQGMDDYNAALWAGYESRDYLDFQRSGSRMLNARRLVLFLNAMLQGLDRTVRTMTAEGDMRTLMRPLVNVWNRRRAFDGLTPDETYQAGRAYKYWVKLALVGVAGLMLRSMVSDNEDYEYGFSDYTKSNYWLIPAGNYWISIPKPFEHAVLSNIFERSYEISQGDQLAWPRLTSALAETYMPPHEITAANLPIQLYANRTATGAPIVPQGLEDLDPHLQFTATTSQVSVDFAAGLSRYAGIEVSPAQLDHVFSGVGGEFFRSPARVLDGDAPALNAPDIPVLNRFLREPGRGGTPQRVEFNDAVMRSSGTLNRAAGTLRDIRERGDMDAAQRFLTDRDPFERRFALLQVGFEPEERRLHPMTRARVVTTEIGRIRRELQGARPLASETLFLPELTPRQRRDALEALDDISSAEMQAALVMSGAPGFANRQAMDVEARYDRLEAISPGVSILLRARLLSGRERALDYDTVRDLWPEAQRRLDRDGFRANLGDLAGRAERDFGVAGMRELELQMRGGRRRSNRERDRELESFDEAIE